MLTPNYSLAHLTMNKVEIQLYSVDENMSTTRHLANQTRTHTSKHANKRKLNMSRKNTLSTDLSQIRCYKCNKTGHYANKCPQKSTLQNTITQKKVI